MAYKPEDDNAGVISPNLYATPMRNLTENKGLLHKKGMLYAGTGTSKEFVCGVNEDKTDKKILVPVTTAINPSNAAEGSVLIKKSTEDGGWIVDKIDANSLKDNAVTTQKIQNGQVTAAKLGSDIVNTTSQSANGITVTLQQNATTKKLDIGLTSDRVINATNATYAQYASEDTSKGTIEERLTSLGFNLGYITLNSDVALWPQFSSDMILDEGRTQLQILRCGNYAMIPTQIMRNGSSGKSLEPLYFTAQVKLTGGEIIGTISNNCIPDRTQIIVGTINIDDKLAGTGTVFVEQFLIKGRDGAPEDLWNLHSTWTQVNEAPIGSIIYLNVSNRGISNLMSVHFPYVGPTPVNSGYSDYRWTVPSDFSVKNLTSISLYSTPID